MEGADTGRVALVYCWDYVVLDFVNLEVSSVLPVQWVLVVVSIAV